MDIVTLGLIIGMANALLAVGLVLIHKANRVINMAHGELGAFAVGMMLLLTRRVHLNYWLALVLSLAAAGALAAVIERLVLRRLFRSPRLIVFIATIGVAQLVIVLRLILPKPTLASGASALAGGASIFPVPFRSPSVVFDRVVLFPQHFMTLVAGPLLVAAVVVFLRYSAYGIALRAAAENAARARLLGIPVRRVSTIAWVVGAVLSGAASILLAPIIGFSATEAVGLPILMRGLAAATVARMESVSVAFGAGLALGVVDQLVFFWTGRSGLTDVVLLVVILTALLTRRGLKRRTVSAEESSWEVAEPVRPLPVEVRQHPRWRLLLIATGVGVVVAGAAAPFTLSASATFFIGATALVATVVVSLTVLTGWAGQMSIGQWAVAGAGGVLGAKLLTDAGLPFFVAFTIAAVAGGVIALVLGLPALRLEGTSLAVVTLGFAVTASSWLFEQPWFSPTGLFTTPSFMSTRVFYAVGLVYMALVIVGLRSLQHTRVGRNIIAVRDNPGQAASFGVPIVRTKLTAFVISGVIASAAGFVWTMGVGAANGSIFPPGRSLSIVAAAVIGGLGTISGALVGALYLWGIPYFLSSISPYIGLLSTGFGLLVLVTFLPGGLVRPLFTLRDLLARAVTGIDVRAGSDAADASVADRAGDESPFADVEDLASASDDGTLSIEPATARAT